MDGALAIGMLVAILAFTIFAEVKAYQHKKRIEKHYKRYHGTRRKKQDEAAGN